MTKYLIDEELMASIADATKEKKGLDTIEAEDIPEAIASISGTPFVTVSSSGTVNIPDGSKTLRMKNLKGKTVVENNELKSVDVSKFTVNGKNLFDVSKVVNLAIAQLDVVKIVEYLDYRGFAYKLQGETKITVSRKNTTDFNRMGIGFTYEEPISNTLVYDSDGANNFIIAHTQTEITVDVLSQAKYMFVYLSNQGDEITEDSEFQIEQGAVKTEYEPYHSPTEYPLTFTGKSARTVRDEIDLANKKYIQRVGVVDLGTLVWSNEEHSGYSIFRTLSITNAKRHAVGAANENQINSNGYTSVTTVSTSMADMGIIINSQATTANRTYIRDNRYSTPEEFKSAMSGVMLYYELAEPIITDITDEISAIVNSSDATVTFDSDVTVDSVIQFVVSDELEHLDVIENGTYIPNLDVAGYSSVTVNVPSGEPVLDTLSVTENGTYTPPSGTDGYDEVSVNVPFAPYVTVSGSGAIEAPSSSSNAIVQKIYGKSTVVNQSVESVNITTVTIGDVDYPLTFEGSSINSVRDELYADANLMVKRVGKVDLGTLVWTYSNIGSAGLKVFRTTSISDMHYGTKSDTSYIGNLLCPLYTATNYSTISTTSREDMSMACYHTGSDDLYFYIYNSEYTDAVAFRNAMSGVYLYYELSSPQTSSVSVSIEGPIDAGQFVSYDSEVEPDSVVLFTVSGELTSLSVTSNGTYTPETGVAGFDEVVVNVPTSEDTLHTFLEGPGTIEYNSLTLTNLSYAMFLAYVDAPNSNGFGTKTHNYITKINAPNLSKIYGFACTGQDNLTEITVGNNCNIDASGRAFSYCSSLSKINGHMVLNFGNRPDHMFAYCSAIRWNSADWSGLRTLPDSFFAYSGIDEFDFARLEGFHDNKQFQGCTNLKKVYYRHFYAFSSYMFDGCTSLEDFYIQYTGGKISMGSGSFNSVPNTMRLHVPASLLSEYEADGNWNRFELIGDAEPLLTMMAMHNPNSDES